jgi:hypothetical protein
MACPYYSYINPSFDEHLPGKDEGGRMKDEK